jgi:predicted nucleotidyltransferase component of viral defense system
MLKGRDVQAIAGKAKIRDTQIEKDYVLSWLLWGIAQSTLLYENLIFKGGTVLKKAYFEDYRFSEDLDFTLINSALADDQIMEAFRQILELVSEESGMPFNISEINKHQSGSIAFYIYFTGPLGGKVDGKSVKIDITRGEKLLFIENLWNQYLAHQIANLPKFDLVCRALNRHFKVLR